MSEPSQRTWAVIDLDALRKNLALVRARCPRSNIYPVIKANAYGHGMIQAARAVLTADTPIAGLAVAALQEALTLHEAVPGRPIMLLNGFVNEDELRLCLERGIEPVIHSPYQAGMAVRALGNGALTGKRKFWIKMNSGMNRLGMNAAAVRGTFSRLRAFPDAQPLLMSHLAWADDMDNPDSRGFTDRQMEQFLALRKDLEAHGNGPVPATMAASAGILTRPDTHLDYVRPGIMLYGGSPLARQTGADMGLHPVMSLHSRLIAINEVPAGGAIGYNATYVCDEATRVGTVSIGYGDGYPRSAPNGTPLLVKTGPRLARTRLIGRVSMDMITIDLSDIAEAQVNDEVILWGPELCADEVAAHTGTISYEMFCKITRRVPFSYTGITDTDTQSSRSPDG